MSFYELSKRLSDKNAIQKDIEEITELLKNKLYEKYFKKIHREIQLQKTHLKQKHNEELEFFYSLKPFLDKSGEMFVDKFTDCILTMQMLDTLDVELNKKSITPMNENKISNEQSIYEVHRKYNHTEDKKNFNTSSDCFDNYILILFLFCIANETDRYN